MMTPSSNINQPIFQVNPQTPDDDPFQVDPQPAEAGPSCIIHPAHIIGGALADPQVDDLNRGHIACHENAASWCCAYSIHQQTTFQQCHENCLAQQQHIFQINDQPMQQPLEPDEECDDQQQQKLEILQYAEVAQNYQQYYQSQAENHYDGDFDDEMEQHIRQVEEQEIGLEEQRLAEFLHQCGLPTAHKTFTDLPQQHSLGGMNIECWHCHALRFNAEKA